MSNLIKINNVEIQVKEYHGRRVCTFKDIDLCHGRPEGTARAAFNRNKKRFIEGEDYFVRNMYEAKNEFGITAPSGLTLITESGYLMVSKVFDDDLAWEVQRQLVNNYFRRPEPKTKFKTRLESLEEKYLEALKNADICRDNKKAFYNAYIENERHYRKYLELEHGWQEMADSYKKEIEKLKNAEFLNMCSDLLEKFPTNK